MNGEKIMLRKTIFAAIASLLVTDALAMPLARLIRQRVSERLASVV